MNKSKEGSLPMVIRKQENDAKTLADIAVKTVLRAVIILLLIILG